MYKLLILLTLFVGFLVSETKADATDHNDKTLSNIQATKDNPWDPRTGEIGTQATDDSGKGALPEPNESESSTEE